MEDNKTEISYEWDLNSEVTEETEVTLEMQEQVEDNFSLELDHFEEKDQEDKLWQARTGLNFDTLCGAIETIIFMSDRPVPLLKIRSTIDADLPLRVIHDSLARLQSEYEAKHHGLRLQEVAEGYQFRTKATYSRFVQDLFKINSLVLSPTALEVLAIIAYKQPISKNVIEDIRGVDSSHIIRGLMDKRLVRISGRSEEMGRPSQFSTTTEFLEVFNLADLNQLPSEYELEELSQANDIGAISDIRTIVRNTDKEKFSFDEIDELDKLAESIKLIPAETLFTKTLSIESRKTVEGEEVKKSAFDILEEFVLSSETRKQNELASQSDTLTTAMDTKIVSAELLNSNIFLNAPKFEELEEGEEFIIPDIDDLDFDAAMDAHQVSEESLEAIADEDGEDLFAEAKALEDELEAAFNGLRIDGFSFDGEQEVDQADEDDVSNKINALDDAHEQLLAKAKDLDIDLNFDSHESED